MADEYDSAVEMVNAYYGTRASKDANKRELALTKLQTGDTPISLGAFLASQIGKYSWRRIADFPCVSGPITILTEQNTCQSFLLQGNRCVKCASTTYRTVPIHVPSPRHGLCAGSLAGRPGSEGQGKESQHQGQSHKGDWFMLCVVVSQLEASP